jgi:hypothetical protein
MPAMFHEIVGNNGVDEDTFPPKIIVPHPGANFVALTGGKGLRPEPNMHIKIVEIDAEQVPLSFLIEQALGIVQNALGQKNPINPLAGNVRIFRIESTHIHTGSHGTDFKALNSRGRAEATLHVTFLNQRVVKIAVRPVQVRRDDGRIDFHADFRGDIQDLVDTMNLIWTAQANVHFDLVSAEAKLVDDGAAISKALDLKAESAPLPQVVDMKKFGTMFANFKHSRADFTYFLVHRAADGQKPVEGVTDPSLGISLIGDDMSPSTMAHEAGHLLGAVGHKPSPPKGPNRLLMNEGGPGVGLGKIPFNDVVQMFNKNFH